MFASIIVPVDGSEPSNAAIDLGVALSKACGASVTLCHVLAVPRPAHDAGGFAREQLMGEEVKAGHVILDAGAQRAAVAGVSVGKVLQTGSPVDGILDEARDRHCDAIVMGSRGRGSVARAILGSVTCDVISRATIPVIVAPHLH
jgi:nucleotide-binding universal stress UspA family protein